MNKLIKASIAAVLVSNALSIAYADSENTEESLDTIEVISNKFKEREKTYKKSGAVTIRDEINKSDKDLDAIVRSAPGTFTQMNKAAGAVTVNVRGGTGFGRVNSMVDGVTQTFYSSGGDTGGKGGASSQFGAAIDPIFLTSVEINRGSFKGAGGANALMGSANFKTIGVDDVLRFDRNIGGMIKYSNGDNDLKPEYMVAVAGKKIFDYGGSLGFLYGYSRKTITQNYKVGGGETHKSIAEPWIEEGKISAYKNCSGLYYNYHPDEKEFCENTEIMNANITPFDPEKVKQKPQSHLFKIEYGDDYNLLEIQYRKLTNHLASRSIDTDTKQINYNFTIPDNDFINLNLLYSKNKNTQNYDVGSSILDRIVTAPLQGVNKSTTFDISNTFTFNLPKNTTLSITPGINRLTNTYSKNRYPHELRIFKICTEEEWKAGRTDCLTPTSEHSFNVHNNDEIMLNSLPTNSFFPKGEQTIKTSYLNNELKLGIFTFDYNLNSVKWKNEGEIIHKIIQTGQTKAQIQAEMDEKWNEMLYDNKDDEAQEFVDKYFDYEYFNACKGSGKSDNFCGISSWTPYREPNFKEILNSENKTAQGSFRNYSFMLTANINDYFTPFFSYSKTHRAPTIQEMFFSNMKDIGINYKEVGVFPVIKVLNLSSETARTKQIGFNGFMEGAITDNDKIGYKFTAYQTKINGFIHNVGKWGTVNRASMLSIFHQNHSELVKMRGLEAEFSYDMGSFFTNIAYSRHKTNQPASYSDISRSGVNPTADQASAQSFGLTKVTILPNSYGSIELGTRLFDQKLTLGGIAKYYGVSKRSKYKTIKMCEGWVVAHNNNCSQEVDGQVAEYEEVESQPLIFDLYAIYEPTENLMFKLNVENITDRKYANPLDANNDSASQYIAWNIKQCTTDEPCFIQNNFARGRTFKFSLSYKF